MERFSHAYKMCRKVIGAGKFADEWQRFLTKEANIGARLGRSGPNPGHAGSLDKLRKKILATPDGQRGALLTAAATNAKGAGSVTDRVASLKMLWHLYLESERGGQQVWIYSPPVDDATWVFDEIKGANSTYEPKIDKVSEVYTVNQRKIISTRRWHRHFERPRTSSPGWALRRRPPWP